MQTFERPVHHGDGIGLSSADVRIGEIDGGFFC